MGTPESSLASLAAAPLRSTPASRTPVTRFDPALACALLEGTDVDAGMRYVLEGLQQDVPARDPAWCTLLSLLSQMPLVAESRACASGHARLEAVYSRLRRCDSAESATPFGLAAERWFRTHSALARALRRRTDWLTARVAALDSHGAGRVVALYAAPAPELDVLAAIGGARAPLTLVEFDERTIAALRGRRALADAVIQRAALADVLGGTYRAFDCDLVYAPSLAAHLPAATTVEVLDAVFGWLRPGGAVVLPVYTSVPERGFLARVAGCAPNVLLPQRLLDGFAARADTVVSVEEDPDAGLAHVILERPR